MLRICAALYGTSVYLSHILTAAPRHTRRSVEDGGDGKERMIV